MWQKNIRLCAQFFGALVVLFGLAGCASVPTAEFSAYQQSFSSVKTGAEDLYLRAGIVAENIANRPEKDASITERLKELEARRAALSARLAAIEMIEDYNRILSSLAAGTYADDLKSDITGLQQNLSSFNVTQITSILKKATPFAGVISQGIAFVEDAVKKKKFQDAILEAQRPLTGILDVLIEDSNDLQDIFIPELKREQDPYRKQVDSCGSRFQRRIRELKLTDDLEGLLARHNQIRLQLRREGVKQITHQSTVTAADPTPADIEALTLMVDQAEINVINYNQVEEKIVAQSSVLEEYRNTLQATKKAFMALPTAIESTRFTATTAFIQQARDLRKAVLRLQEAK